MVSEIREGDPSESQVEITLKAVENLLNGPKLLFHDRFQQCEYKLTELYDIFYQLDQNESIGIRYENISKSAQSNVDAYILSKQAKLSSENVWHTGNAFFFAINDERPLSFLESESITTQAAKNERRKKGILGILIVLPYEEELTEIRVKLNGIIPLLQQACYYDLVKARTSMEERFHKSLIQLNRIAQGEVVDKQTGFRAKSGSIFNLGAEILCQSFQPFAKLCVIFDASSVRYVFSGSSNLSSNSVESSKGSAGSNCVSTTEMSSSIDGQSELAEAIGVKNIQEANNVVPELPEVEGYDKHPEPFSMFGRNEHKRDNSFDIPQSYVVSSNSMYGTDVGTFVDSRFSTDKGQSSMSEYISTTSANFENAIGQVERLEFEPLDLLAEDRKSEVDKDDHDGPDGLLDFLPAASGRVMCSFPQSRQSVALLGMYGGDQEKYSKLDGNFLRRSMAGYFASARQSGLASQVFCEMGDSTETTDQGKKSNFRQALGEIDEDNVILTAACFDRLGQPAFMIVLLIQESSIVFDQFRRRMIELIGTSLTNAALHIRAEELSQAQNIFTQKVQHELRTPLHGILGVNEAVLYALRHAQDRASKSEKHEGWLEQIESLLTELVTLTHSITHSADDLSTLIDDLVDFSTPFAKTDPWLGMPTDSSQARDKREISFQVFLSILSVVSEQRWQSHLTKRDSPTTTSPELFFWFNPTWKDSESNIEINVDAVSRVLGKLVANAIEATVEGMVRIEVSLQDVKFNKVIENVPLKEIKADEAKPLKVKKTHILTIKVFDTGHGMSKSFLAHQIFEAYQKEDLDSPGIGLSLALCRSTVEEMGGHIVADSEEGKWTVISVSLPVTLIDKRKSNFVQRNRQGSYASTDTATPDLNVAFCGCKNSVSLCALRKDLLQKFGMVDVTDELNKGKIEKVDILFIVPDGLTDEEESFSFVKGTSISLSIIMPIDQQWKKRLSLKKKEFFEQISAKSHNVREVQRPLTYKNVQKLFGIIRHFCFQSAHNSVTSPDDNPVISSDKNYVETSSVEEIESSNDQDTQNPFEETFSAASSVKSFKVLVVEDNPINTKIITALLKRAEIDFIEAVDGEQGVEMFKQELPALVLLDINMPKMNGFDAAIAMRAHPSPYQHHIAAVTALSSEVDRARGFEAGMDAWYTKPMRMARLIEEIKRVRDAQKKLFFNFSDQQNFSPPLS